MIFFAICSEATGEVLRTGGTSATTVAEQARPSEFVVITDGTIADDTHFWANGWVEYPPSPSAAHVWDFAILEWRDPRSPEDIKAAARAQVKLRRDKALEAGTTVSGAVVSTDLVTQTRVTGAALSALMDPDYTVQWKVPDGSFLLLTAPEILALAQAVREHIQSCFDREAELLAAIDAGLPYDIGAGWPGPPL